MAENFESAPTVAEEDDFDRLRRKSTRAETVYDELDTTSEGSGRISPVQWFIIAVLVLLNVIAFGVGVTLIL